MKTLPVPHSAPALGTADALAATQTPGLVTVRVSGSVPTPAHRVALVPTFLTVFPPEFRLEVIPPTNPAAQLITPFAVEASFIAETIIASVKVVDTNGAHTVNVDHALD